MKVPVRLAENRIAAAFLHVVFPTASIVLLGSIFWIGFSGGSETVLGSLHDTGGAADVTFSAVLKDGSDLKVHADKAVMLKDEIHVSEIRGLLVQPDGHIRTLKANSAETTWSLDSADFKSGTLLETAEDGTEVEFNLHSGSADFIRLNGRKVTALLRKQGDDSIQSLVADYLDFDLETGFGELTGGAKFTWHGGASDDWFRVSSEGFLVKTRESAVESIGAADFEFYGGRGKAGQLQIAASAEGGSDVPSGTVSLVDGVEFTYFSPLGASE